MDAILMRNFRNFTGKDVVITAMGAKYRGRLIEMTDVSVLLRMSTGHAEIPIDGIASIEPDTGAGKGFMSPSPLAGLGKQEPE